MRAIAFGLVFAALMAATAALGSRGGAFSTTAAVPPDPSVNLIAYVDLEGRISVASPDGSSVARLSPDMGLFTWPSWSPDASRIAFSGITTQGNARGPLTLFALRVGDSEPSAIFANEPNMGPILSGMPHYTLWSPNSRWLLFMASTPRGLALFIDDLEDELEPQFVLTNAPLYASWSPDSANIMVHGGVNHFIVSPDEAGRVSDLDIQSSTYRTPAWRPSGNGVGYVSEDADGGEKLYLDEPESGRRKVIDDARGTTAFLWSPDGGSLAVAHSGQFSRVMGGSVYQGVRLYSPDGARKEAEVNENLIAFFWSPDSTKLAYVTLPQGERALRWNILDLVGGARWSLVDFLPTSAQLNILLFFDQFAYSHSTWSPDSGSIVFAGSVVGNVGVSASQNLQETPRILALSVEPDSIAQTIADGLMATWSPR